MIKEPAREPKAGSKLLPATIEEIEKILASDETVKLTPTKKGIMVYKERLKRAYTQP